MNECLAIEHEVRPLFPKSGALLWHGIPSQRYFVGFLQGAALLILATWLVLFAFKLPAFRESDLSVISLVSVGIISLLALIAVLFGPTFKRRRSQYALSTHRAFIRFHWPLLGPRIYSWRITSGTSFHIVRPAPLSIYFAEHRFIISNPPFRIGFQRIADGDDVLAQMNAIREGKHGKHMYVAPSVSNDNSL